MWKIALTGPGTFALQITMAASEQNPLIDASVLNRGFTQILELISTWRQFPIGSQQLVFNFWRPSYFPPRQCFYKAQDKDKTEAKAEV